MPEGAVTLRAAVAIDDRLMRVRVPDFFQIASSALQQLAGTVWTFARSIIGRSLDIW